MSDRRVIELIDEVITDNDADAFIQHKTGHNVNNQG